jgi:predicted phage tail protein
VPTGGYYVRVRARNANGTSAATADLPIAVGCSFPAAPSTFTAAVAGQTVTLGWSIAAGVTQTIVEAGITPGFASALVTVAFAAPATGTAFPGVPSGTYYAHVRAVNSCGQSGPSVERTIVVP